MICTSPPSRVRRRIAAALVAALGAGLAGCAEEVEVANAAPEVSVEGWCTAEGRTFLLVGLQDLESDPVDLRICAGNGAAMATGPAGDGLEGLSSSPEGRRHFIEWSAEDSGCSCPEPGGDEVAGPCAAPPTGAEEPTYEVRVSDVPDQWRSLGQFPIAPLGSCP